MTELYLLTYYTCLLTYLSSSVQLSYLSVFIQFFINFQASTQDRAFLTKLPWLMRLRVFQLNL